MDKIIEQTIEERYALYNADAMAVLPQIPTGSVHLSVYSPPFAHSGGGLYHYSSSPKDLSNSKSYEEFFEHYEFIVSEIARVTMPGRLSGVHCMDVPTGNTGLDALMDFPGDIIRQHTQCIKAKCSDNPIRRAKGLCGHGRFDYVARYHVWKEPLTVRNRTMVKALAHKAIVEDSSRCTVASADYLLMFRRKGSNPIPIAHPEGLMEYAGAREVPKELLRWKGWTGSQIENRYSHWIWRQYASAFWDDVRLDRVLPFRAGRDEDDEKHVHPLQLDVIERCLHLWSNPGEIVLTPFMGVGSEVYGAVLNGRRAIGIELKPSYYKQACLNVPVALKERQEQDRLLFDFSTPEDELVEIED